MNKTAKIFDQIVRDRRSVRIYDANATFDGSAVQRSMERAVLAPNSSNLQLWEFYRVHSPAQKKLLSAACFDQPAAATARELIVVVCRPDKWKPRKEFMVRHFRKNNNSEAIKKKLHYYNRLIPMLLWNDPLGLFGRVRKTVQYLKGLFGPVPREVGRGDVRVMVHRSVALAAQTFMLSIKAEGYDSCPMEGYDSARVKKVVGLPRRSEISMVIAVGPGKPEGIYGPRLRVDNAEVLFAQ